LALVADLACGVNQRQVACFRKIFGKKIKAWGDFMPKVELSSPSFVKTKKVKINAFVENGIMLNRKFKRTIAAWNNEGTDKRDLTFTSKAVSYNMMLGIDLEMSDSGGLNIGYSFSTLDYSKKFDYYDTENTLSTINLHGVFIRVYINL
jgi:hypothetical protein